MPFIVLSVNIFITHIYTWTHSIDNLLNSVTKNMPEPSFYLIFTTEEKNRQYCSRRNTDMCRYVQICTDMYEGRLICAFELNLTHKLPDRSQVVSLYITSSREDSLWRSCALNLLKKWLPNLNFLVPPFYFISLHHLYSIHDLSLITISLGTIVRKKECVLPWKPCQRLPI